MREHLVGKALINYWMGTNLFDAATSVVGYAQGIGEMFNPVLGPLVGREEVGEAVIIKLAAAGGLMLAYALAEEKWQGQVKLDFVMRNTLRIGAAILFFGAMSNLAWTTGVF